MSVPGTKLRSTALMLSLTALLPMASNAATLTVLHSFTGNPDGAWPYAGVIQASDGNFYGTTAAGGGTTNCNSGGVAYSAVGCGTVFKMTATGSVSLLHSFSVGDGAIPLFGSLLQSTDGNLWGTTSLNNGSVFNISTTGTFKQVHNFQNVLPGSTYGSYPQYGVVLGNDGNYYGVTGNGGANNMGTIYKLTPSGTETTLHSFGSVSGEYYGRFSPTKGADGNFYGTSGNVIYKITPSGTYSVLHTLSANSGEGTNVSSGLTLAMDGNFYGEIQYGGSSSNCTNGGVGCGQAFKMTPAGVVTILHTFAGGADGALPYGGLMMAADGNLYGTTKWGGNGTNCTPDSSYQGCGTLFKIVPGTKATTVLYTFGKTAGTPVAPTGHLIQAKSGLLYGTSDYGGSNGYGTVFKVALP